MKLYGNAAEMYRNIAANSLTYKEKMEAYTNECESCILSGDFLGADKALKRAMDEANLREKEGIKIHIINFYKKLAEDCEKQMKRSQASKIYEKLLKMDIPETEKDALRAKITGIQDKIGKIKDPRYLRGL